MNENFVKKRKSLVLLAIVTEKDICLDHFTCYRVIYNEPRGPKRSELVQEAYQLQAQGLG